MTRWLQDEIERLLYPPFADPCRSEESDCLQTG
jgi:hypothetical protein